MQVNPREFAKKLEQSNLPPFIMLFGDEPQQKLDIIDAIRQKAKQEGFEERQSFTLDSEFDWKDLTDAMQSMSLFSSKQYIELNMISAKPGTQGSKQFVSLLDIQSPDVVLLINGPKAGKDVQNAKWFKTLASHAWVTLVYELQQQQLKQYLATTANELGIHISQHALSVVADLCEGNLMAAKQELYKLQLLFPASQVIDVDDVNKVMVQHSRFTIFQLTDCILGGEVSKSINILGRLENEGIEPVIILWNLVKEAQILTKLAELQYENKPINYRQFGIWQNKQALYNNALSRLNPAQLNKLNDSLSHVDIAFKSTYVAKPYVVLSHIILLFQGNQLNELELAI